MIITVKIPGKEEPGFLRRQKQALSLMTRLGAGATPELIDELAQFLSAYVTSDTCTPAEAVWEMSEDDFFRTLEAIGKTNAPPLVEKNAAPSVGG